MGRLKDNIMDFSSDDDSEDYEIEINQNRDSKNNTLV